MQTLIRVGCCARMRRGMPCRTFRGWHATRRVASIGQREVQIQADGRRAAWRAETMQIVCDFRPPTISVATRTLTSGARRNGRRARDAGRSSVHVAAQTRTDACRLDGRPALSSSPKWGLARSRLRGFWSGFVLTGVSPASCSKRPDVAVRSARHEASGSVYFIKLSAGLGSCFPQLFGENKAR